MGEWLVAWVISLQSFLWGYGVSALNSAVGKRGQHPGLLSNDLQLNNLELQLLTASTIAGAWLGCIVSSYPADRFGLRLTTLCNNSLFIGGSLLCIVPTFEVLLTGRLVLGLAIGIGCNVAPVLLSEIAPSSSRGQITSLHQLQITIGILVVGVMSFVLVKNVPQGWRYLLSFPAVIATLQLLLSPYVPESPRWLIQRGRHAEAAATLQWLRGEAQTDDIEGELMQIQDNLDKEKEGDSGSLMDVLREPKLLAVGFGLMFFSAMTGIDSVMFYSTKIFMFAGVSRPILSTVCVGTVNVLATVLAFFLIDRVGRRPLLLIGNSLMAVSLAVLAWVLMGGGHLSVAMKGYVCVALVLIYVVGFAVGLGAVAWVYLAEVVPFRIRNRAMSLFSQEDWLWNLLIAALSLSAMEALGGGTDDASAERGIAWLFLIFACMSILALVFTWCLLKESKGNSSAHSMFSSASSPNDTDNDENEDSTEKEKNAAADHHPEREALLKTNERLV